MRLMSSFKIAGRGIGDAHPAFIIAEAGSNHDGRFLVAKRLINIAAECGCDAVKFQSFKADKIASRFAHPKARLNDRQFSKYGKSVHELYKNIELPDAWIPKLIAHAKKKKIIFLSTPFDEESADWLEKCGMPAFKVSSYEFTHLRLIDYLARKKKPLMLSTAMATLPEIRASLVVAHRAGASKIALLHCVVGYPPRFEDLNLKAITLMRREFPVPIGYSDHSRGLAAPLASVALGAKIVEKHFTHDKNAPGPDHFFALSPEELRTMVRGIRETEAALGGEQKGVFFSEKVHYQRGRRGLYAKTDLVPGQKVMPYQVDVLRPRIGIGAERYFEILGRTISRRVSSGSPLLEKDLKGRSF